MRQPYAHEAEIVVEDGGDLRAPGGAITEELCGALDHEPACPLTCWRPRSTGPSEVRADEADQARRLVDEPVCP